MKKIFQNGSFLRKHPFATIFLACWSMYFSSIWANMLILRSDGLYAGHPYVWADWGLHVALANAIVFKPVSLWFASYPIFAGAKLTYPSLVNILSGLLIKVGVPFTWSFTVPSFIFSVVALWTLWLFFFQLLRRERQAVLAMTTFLFSGGLGGFILGNRLGLEKIVTDSTIVLTQIDDLSIQTNNIVSSMWVPQRAFLMGLPVGLFIFSTLLRHFIGDEHKEWKLFCAGLFAGLLPLIHTHTFFVTFLFSAFVFFLSIKKIKLWLWYGIPAGVVGLLIYYLFLYGNVSGSTFISYHPGWLVSGGFLEWLVFWVKNWGVFGITTLIGTLLLWQNRKQNPMLTVTTLFFWGLFLVGNLIQFQPQLWDNTKIFAWCYIGLSPAFAYLCRRLWMRKSMIGNSIVILLVITASFSGFIDVFHNLDFSRKTFQMLSSDQIELATWARLHSQPDAVFLTKELVDNPIAMMAGRSTLVGYSGWMLNFGLPYPQRLKDIEAFYIDPNQHLDVLEKYQVQYIIIEDSDPPPDLGVRGKAIFTNSYGTIYEVYK